MPDFSKEELRDVMHAIRHYQIYHVSINNPRYSEYNNILSKLEEGIASKDAEPDSKFSRQVYLNWLEQQQQEWDLEIGSSYD